MATTHCPYCDIEVSESAIEGNDGCCPECGAAISVGGSLYREDEDFDIDEYDEDDPFEDEDEDALDFEDDFGFDDDDLELDDDLDIDEDDEDFKY